MKKNKTLAYMLAAALLVGGTFLGTKALFQDTDTSQNPLILTTGTVDISIKADEEWKRNIKDSFDDDVITSGDYPPVHEGVGTEFTNVKPGDTFTKYISILNEDSIYDVDLQIKEELINIPDKLQDYIVIEDGANPKPPEDESKYEDRLNHTKGSQFKNLTSIPAGTNTGGYVTIKILDTPEALEAFRNLTEEERRLDLKAIYTVHATQAQKTKE